MCIENNAKPEQKNCAVYFFLLPNSKHKHFISGVMSMVAMFGFSIETQANTYICMCVCVPFSDEYIGFALDLVLRDSHGTR